MNLVNKMLSLSANLPDKDTKLAESFIVHRDFESLKELVSSAIIKIKKNLVSKTPKEEYKKIDLESLELLNSVVDEYLSYLCVDTIPEEPEDEIEVEEDEFY